MKLNHTMSIVLNVLTGMLVLVGCAPHGELLDDGAQPNAKPADERVELSVSGVFSAPEADSCQPMNLPLTAYLTNAFSTQMIVEETATWRAGGCLHEQLLAAPVDALGTLAYNVLCQGGDDVRLCGVVAKRSCSAGLLMKWAAARSEPVASRSPIFGFAFEVPPQSDAARMALYRRAQTEVRTLLDQAKTVMNAMDLGTRNCPDEDRAQLEITYREHVEISNELDRILNSD
jgi:hypothetical protein